MIGGSDHAASQHHRAARDLHQAPVVLGPEPATNEVAGGHAAVATDWTPAALADAVRRARSMTAAELEAAREWAATFTWERTIRQTREVLVEMSAR